MERENRLEVWGDEEVRQRMEDIADAKDGLITLTDAKSLAEQRRMAAGLTPDEAQRAVNAATRRNRAAQSA